MSDTKKMYDIAVIGGGAAGSMAAIRAGQLGKSVILAERNDCIGKKIMITGKGRCNLTNTAALDVFIKKFSPAGEFLRTSFYSFFNEDVIGFFRSRGLGLKVERQGRVFPVTDKAGSVVSVLVKCLKEGGVEVAYSTRAANIEIEDGHFIITSEDAVRIRAKKVILATGGASYRATGSTGDGFIMARRMGHMVTDLKPGLVPLKTKERWVRDLRGLSLENVRLSFMRGDKRIDCGIGDVMFTHFGVSGPLVLDMSGEIVSLLGSREEIRFMIDLKPGLTKERLESKLVGSFVAKGNTKIKNFMQDMLPKRIIDIFLSLSDVQRDKPVNQVTKRERGVMIDTLKAFPFTVTGCLSIEDAMVTVGGVSIKDINPRTMESKKVPGLYFAGEIIEGAAPSGGYNLQQAFSTGYLAGEKSSEAVLNKEA
ncbi:MAG: NAD(P)/FAD-dependent oxidoreductase [Candidatus Omnitrophota bacterium]